MTTDRKFLNRNHTYEVNKVGYNRTVSIESPNEETFMGKKSGTKGSLLVPPNAKILITIEGYLDGNRLNVIVEKFDFDDNCIDTFKAIMDTDELRKLTDPTEEQNHFLFSFSNKKR